MFQDTTRHPPSRDKNTHLYVRIYHAILVLLLATEWGISIHPHLLIDIPSSNIHTLSYYNIRLVRIYVIPMTVTPPSIHSITLYTFTDHWSYETPAHVSCVQHSVSTDACERLNGPATEGCTYMWYCVSFSKNKKTKKQNKRVVPSVL